MVHKQPKIHSIINGQRIVRKSEMAERLEPSWVSRKCDGGASVAIHMECLMMHLSKAEFCVSLKSQGVTAAVCFMHGEIPIYSNV